MDQNPYESPKQANERRLGGVNFGCVFLAVVVATMFTASIIGTLLLMRLVMSPEFD
jgi:hypothetical protein